MLGWTLAFLGGVLFSTRFAQFPSQWFLLGLGVIALLTLIFRRRYSGNILLAAFIIGMLFCFWHLSQFLQVKLPVHWVSKTVLASGTVVSIPETTESRIRFEFLIDSVSKPYQLPYPMRVLLSDYSYHQKLLPIQVGERWQFAIRLKSPRGFWNPGSFNIQRWLLQRRIQVTGTIVKQLKLGDMNQKIDRPKTKLSIQQLIWERIHKWRVQIALGILHEINEGPLSSLLNALVTGIRHEIPQHYWSIMRATGTNHLFAISGLHIGFIAGLTYQLVNRIWRRLGFLSLYLPAQQAAHAISLIAAFFYSLLSGFALPAQRALIMLTVFISVRLTRRLLPPWRAWCFALLIILLLDPLVVLSESFWLSFSAVALILYGVGTWVNVQSLSKVESFWHQWGQTQWIISIGLIPLSLLFFEQIALAGFFANLIAIPWIGFLVVPPGLIGALLYWIWPSIGGLLLLLSSKALAVLWQFLSYIASLPLLYSNVVLARGWILFTTLVSTILWLMPRGFPGRCYLASLWLVPLLFWQPLLPAKGEIWLTLLDVGQGLSAVVRTQKHLLVYDTGPRFGPHFDTGQAVILPFLKQLKQYRIHTLIVSHADNDHSGGALSLIKALPIEKVIASQPDGLSSGKKLPLRVEPCHQGQEWSWDGVHFEILHPNYNSAYEGNNSSCVLRISNGKQSILLPGDIHTRGERVLLNKGLDLSATVLVAPHHGSKTSSSAEFIQKVQPAYVLFPVGFRNRFKFPHPSILKRYYQQGAHAYSTAEEGAIEIKLGKEPGSLTINSFRDQSLCFWQKTSD